MNLLDVLKKAGIHAVNKVLPGTGPVVADMVNSWLAPDNKVDPETVTGDELLTKLSCLNPEVAKLLKDTEVRLAEIEAEKEIKLAENETNKVEIKAEVQRSIHDLERLGKSRSRAIVSIVMAATVLALCVGYPYAVIFIENRNLTMHELVVLLATPALLLKAHFGVELDEKNMVAQLIQGGAVQPVESLGKSIASRVKGKEKQ